MHYQDMVLQYYWIIIQFSLQSSVRSFVYFLYFISEHIIVIWFHHFAPTLMPPSHIRPHWPLTSATVSMPYECVCVGTKVVWNLTSKVQSLLRGQYCQQKGAVTQGWIVIHTFVCRIIPNVWVKVQEVEKKITQVHFCCFLGTLLFVFCSSFVIQVVT